VAEIQVYDIETFTDLVSFRIIGLYDGTNYRWYKSISEAVYDMVKSGGVWYAHNGGKFDFRFLFEFLNDNYRLNFIFRNSRFYKVSVYPKKGRKHSKMLCQLRDSYNLIPAPLKAVCAAFGVTLKGKIRYNTKCLRKLVRYNRKDCVGLQEALTEFENLTSSGLTLTTASQAQREFKADGGSYDDVIRHYGTEAFFREAYYGGRVENFVKSSPMIKLYDINSLYPFAMLNDFPVGHCVESKDFQRKKLGIYMIYWEKPDSLKYGILPCRNIEGSLVFSYQSGKGWYCSPEILKALDLGYRINFIRGYYWKRTRRVFEEVVSGWYEKRLLSTGAKAMYYKLLLNSLYGRLAIKEDSEDILSRLPTKEEVAKYHITPLDDDGKFFSISRKHHFPNVYVQLAAFVTSYARLVLYDLIVRSEAIYCDTDSVVTTKDLETTKDMGGIKLVAEGDYIGLAPKLMVIYENSGADKIIHLSAKGFNRSQVTLDMFRSGLTGEFDSFVTKVTDLMGQKLCMVKGLTFLTTHEVTKSFRGKFSKDDLLPLWKKEVKNA